MMFNPGWSLSRKNSISCRMDRLIVNLYLAWCIILAAFFSANDMCLFWSLAEHGKAPVRRHSTTSQKSCDDSERRRLFSASKCAMDAYKWVIRWCTQGAPSARWPSLPVSCCASLTMNERQFLCQVASMMALTSFTYEFGMATVRRFVSRMRPSIVFTGPAIISIHLSRASGHCRMAVSGSPMTTNIASMRAARAIFMRIRPTASTKESSTKILAGRGRAEAERQVRRVVRADDDRALLRVAKDA